MKKNRPYGDIDRPKLEVSALNPHYSRPCGQGRQPCARSRRQAPLTTDGRLRLTSRCEHAAAIEHSWGTADESKKEPLGLAQNRYTNS